jgi:hypothetical protein
MTSTIETECLLAGYPLSSSTTSYDPPRSVLGIDPGASGALALVDHTPWRGIRLISLHDMPTVEETVSGKRRQRVDAGALAALIRNLDPDEIALEKVGPRPAPQPWWKVSRKRWIYG